MLRLINKQIALQWIILLGLLSISVYKILNQSQLASSEGGVFLFKNFAYFFSQEIFLGRIIIVAILLLQILLLQLYFYKNDFSAKLSLLPACFFLSIMLVTRSLIEISPFFFTILFLLAVVSIEQNVFAERLRKNVFLIGSIIAIATGFDQSSILLLFLIIATLFINQFSKIKEVGILFWGFFLIYFYFFSYYFLTGQLHEWISTFYQIKILKVINNDTSAGAANIITLITLSIFYVYFILRTKLISDSKVLIHRKRILTLNTWAILLVTCMFLSNSTFSFALGYLFVPITIYLTLLSKESNPAYVNEIVTIITLIVLCL
jgi:hypothetical protein